MPGCCRWQATKRGNNSCWFELLLGLALAQFFITSEGTTHIHHAPDAQWTCSSWIMIRQGTQPGERNPPLVCNSNSKINSCTRLQQQQRHRTSNLMAVMD